MTDKLNLTKRVEIIEARLGIDPFAVVADADAAAERGAEAHAGNPQSDVDEAEVDETDETDAE